MSHDWEIKEGDSLPELEAQIRDPSGDVADLSSVQDVEFRMAHIRSDTLVASSSATIQDAATGRVQYNIGTSETGKEGLHAIEWRVTRSSGETFSYPRADNQTLFIHSGVGRELTTAATTNGTYQIGSLEADSVDTEQLSNKQYTGARDVGETNVAAYADSGTGSESDPYVNALSNAAVSNHGGLFMPDGYYVEDSTVQLSPCHYVRGTGAGQGRVDGEFERGVALAPSSNFSDNVLIQWEPGDTGGIEYMGISGVCIVGERSVETGILATGTRVMWIHNNLFAKFTKRPIDCGARMPFIFQNEFVFNNGTSQYDSSVNLRGTDVRFAWIGQNNIVNTWGGIQVGSTAVSGILITNNRFRDLKDNYVSIQDQDNGQTDGEIKVRGNSFTRVGWTYLGDNHNWGGDSMCQFLDTGSASHNGPVWFTDNYFYGVDTDGGTATASLGLDIPSGFTVTNGLIHKNNVYRSFTQSPSFQLGGMSGDTNTISNDNLDLS